MIESTAYVIANTSGASPIDAGYCLVHADTIVATTDDQLHVSPSAELHLTVGDRVTSGAVSDLGLAPGRYEAHLLVSDAGEVVLDKTVPLLLIAPSLVCRRFGARSGDLAYDLPVIVGHEGWGSGVRRSPWQSLWKTGDEPDIVVDFDAPYKFILWRGMAYAPSWAMNNVLTSNFFVETVEPGIYRDCCEMMSDRECRYSHARILHSSSARVVIHWRYALCDSAYRICRDYWVDELFYIYPDGVAVRNATLYLDPADEDVWQQHPDTGERVPWSMMNAPAGKRSFNDMEFITVNPPGSSAEDNTPMEAMTILDGTDFSRTYQWPTPPNFAQEPLPFLDQYIYRMNYRTRAATFLAAPAAGMQCRLEAPESAPRYVAGARVEDDRWEPVPDIPSSFVTCTHWPITRGDGTSPLTDVAQYEDRPTHTFLGYANSAPAQVRDDGAVTWSWLCGIAPEDDDALRAQVVAWTSPPEIQGTSYSARERAYIVQNVVVQASSLLLELNDRAVINPTFVLLGVEASEVTVRINGVVVEADRVAVGVERTLAVTRTIVMLREMVAHSSAIDLEMR